MHKPMKPLKIAAKTGKFVLLLFHLLAVILPLYWIIITSFKYTPEIINAQHLTYWPERFTLENYEQLFVLFNYGQLLKNSITVSAVTAVCVTLLAILGGYGLARYEFRSKSVIVLFFLITQMIPGILVMIPLYIILSGMGLIDTKFALFIYYLIINLPFCTIMMRSFFERIPATLEEAALIDGCSKMKSLIHVVLPTMLPGIIAVFVFAFIGSWNELIAGTIFTSTTANWTIPVGLKSLMGKNNVQWGMLMAGGIMALLPTAVMFMVMQKFIVEGLTAGAVKE